MDPLGIFALIILTVMLVVFAGVAVWLAMLPGKIAAGREHPQAEAIKVAGWLGVFTGIVWIVAMIWAFTRPGVGLSDTKFEVLDSRLRKLEKGGAS